jgi:hypothetical protein
VLREQIVFGRFLGPRNRLAQKLNVAAAFKPDHSFIHAERELKVMTAFAAHDAFKIYIHVCTRLSEGICKWIVRPPCVRLKGRNLLVRSLESSGYSKEKIFVRADSILSPNVCIAG